MYLEDIKAGRRFIDVAREITQNKPVIVLKGGRTDVGRKTAASHTASLAGNAAVYNAVFKQSRHHPGQQLPRPVQYHQSLL